MQQAVEHLQQELAGVRTGRAHPGLLENLLVDADGDHIPIKACGSVTVRNPQLLAVVLFDTSVSFGMLAASSWDAVGTAASAAGVSGNDKHVPLHTATTAVLWWRCGRDVMRTSLQQVCIRLLCTAQRPSSSPPPGSFYACTACALDHPAAVEALSHQSHQDLPNPPECHGLRHSASTAFNSLFPFACACCPLPCPAAVQGC
jgi:hypothetical protein